MCAVHAGLDDHNFCSFFYWNIIISRKFGLHSLHSFVKFLFRKKEKIMFHKEFLLYSVMCLHKTFRGILGETKDGEFWWNKRIRIVGWWWWSLSHIKLILCFYTKQCPLCSLMFFYILALASFTVDQWKSCRFVWALLWPKRILFWSPAPFFSSLFSVDWLASNIILISTLSHLPRLTPRTTHDVFFLTWCHPCFL